MRRRRGVPSIPARLPPQPCETAASAGQDSDDPAASRRHSDGEAAVSAKPLPLVRSTDRRPTVTGVNRQADQGRRTRTADSGWPAAENFAVGSCEFRKRTVGPGPAMVVRQVVPGVAVSAVVLPDRTPLPLANVRPPLVPIPSLQQPVLQPAEPGDRSRPAPVTAPWPSFS